MTEQVAMTYDEGSLPELEPDEEDPSEQASSNESDEPTNEDEAGEGDSVGGAEDVAADLPSRLAARMGSEHTTWTFADPADAQAWAQAAFEFCSRYCPIVKRCKGDECRLHRFEGQALAVIQP